MAMTPAPQIYLSFNGQCEAAFRFYEQRLGGVLGKLWPYENSPMATSVAPEWAAKIMHGTVTIGGVNVMGADSPEGEYSRPQGFRIFLEPKDPAESERLFEALSENGTIEMPIQQTFWSLRFGVLTDQFGIPWTINCARIPEADQGS